MTKQQRILNLAHATDARLISAVAPAGYGKTTVAEMIASERAYVVYDAEPVKDVFGFAGLLVETPASAEATRVDRGMSLVQLHDTVIDAWTRSDDHPATATFDNLESIADQPDSLDLLIRLIKTAGQRKLILCSRAPLTFLSSRLMPPNEHLRLRLRDLAFTPDEIRALFFDLAKPPLVDQIVALTQGWPVPVLLFQQLARSGQLDGLLSSAALSAAGAEDLRDYLFREVFSPMDGALFNVLLAVVATHSGGKDAVFRTHEADVTFRSLRALAKALPLVDLDDGRWNVHPLVVSVLEGTNSPKIERMRSNAAESYERDGMLGEASRLYLAHGRIGAAANCLVRLVGSRADCNTLQGLDEVRERVPIELSAYYPVPWTTSAHDRRGVVNMDVLVAQGKALRKSLPSPADSPEAKHVDAVLVTCATQLGELAFTDTILAEHLIDEENLLPGDEALLVAATIRDMFTGRTKGALERYRLLKPLINNELLCAYFTLRVEVVLATMGGRFDDARRTLQRVLAYATKAGAARLVALLTQQQAVLAWLAGDDAAVEQSMREIQRTSAVAGDGFLAAIADAWESGSIEGLAGDDTPGRHAFVLLMMAGKATTHIRRRMLLDEATKAAHAAGDLWVQFLILVARAMSDPADRAPLLEEAASLAREIGQVSLLDSATSLLEGGPGGPTLLSLAKRFATSAEPAPLSERVTISALSKSVFRGNERVALSKRASTLVQILAVLKRVRRETLAELLWGHDEYDSGAHALKVLVSRTRHQLGDPSLIKVCEGYYALGDNVDVDYDEVERLLRSLAVDEPLTDTQRRRLQSVYDRFKGTSGNGDGDHASSPVEVAVAATRHDVVACLAADALDRGDISLTIDLANELRLEDPNDEAGNELLIRAQVRSGNRTSALREYRKYADRLQRNFATKPSFTIDSGRRPR